MTIRLLPPVLVNRIAAGEVVERPAGAVKELVENAIDAGAARIEVTLHDGGETLIAVADDGGGMSADELSLAVERHCTSKLPDDDLLHIRALGFRGEALPSIGAVSRLRLVSRPPTAGNAWEIAVEAGRKSAPRPAAAGFGTRVEVRDLFFATPARLKFLKTLRTERELAVDMVRRLAMAYPRDRLFRDRRRRAQPVAPARCRGPGGAARPIARPGFRPERDADRRRARRVSACRARRSADIEPGLAARPVSRRQRPPGARQTARGRGARRLSGRLGARPPSDRGVVSRRAGRRDRRQRPPGQGRNPLSRRGAWCAG